MQPKQYRMIIAILSIIVVILLGLSAVLLLKDKRSDMSSKNNQNTDSSAHMSKDDVETFLGSLPDQWPVLKYKNTDYGFEMEYPKNWNIKVYGKYMAVVSLVDFLSPKSTNVDEFWEHVSVSVDDISSSPKNLETYSKTKIKQKTEMGGIYTLLESREIKINGISAIMNTGVFQNYPEKYKEIDIYVSKSHRVFTINYTTYEINYDVNLSSAKRIMESFKFVN